MFFRFAKRGSPSEWVFWFEVFRILGGRRSAQKPVHVCASLFHLVRAPTSVPTLRAHPPGPHVFQLPLLPSAALPHLWVTPLPALPPPFPQDFGLKR